MVCFSLYSAIADQLSRQNQQVKFDFFECVGLRRILKIIDNSFYCINVILSSDGHANVKKACGRIHAES